MALDGSAELIDLKKRYTKQPIAVLQAYLRAKAKLVKRGLPVVPATGKKINLTVASYAFNGGLLEHLSGKEASVYRTLLQGLPFQYRERAVIAEEAGVSISTVRQAISKLESMGLLARHRVPNSSCVLAFTDTTQLNPEAIMGLKAEYEKQLIEKCRNQPIIKEVLITAPPLLVLEKTILNRRKEDHSASPSNFFFSGGDVSVPKTIRDAQSGHRDDTMTCTGTKDGALSTCTGHALSQASGHIGLALTDNSDAGFESTCTGTEAGFQPTCTGTEAGALSTCTGTEDGFQPTCTGHALSQTSHRISPAPAKHGSVSTCTGFDPDDSDNTDLTPHPTGIDKLIRSLEAETGFNFQVPAKPVLTENQFRLIPTPIYCQSMRCQKPKVFELQAEIDAMIKANAKPMAICSKLNSGGFLGVLRESLGLGSMYDDDFNFTCKLIEPHIQNGVMRHVLSQLAVLRGDSVVQLQTWIAHAKLKANNPTNIGGLLSKVMLKAQQVNTDKLYPEAAVGFKLFLDQLEIGIDLGADAELAPDDDEALQGQPSDSDGDIDLAEEKASRNARRALLRDYTGVVHALMERERESDPGYSAEDLLDLLLMLYDEGDGNNSPVREDAPGGVKVSMVKLALHRAVDADLHPERRPVYLPHWIHEVKKQAMKAAAAA